MSASPFKDLQQALSGSPQWASLRRSWEESDGLQSLLSRKLAKNLASQVLQVRRSDPQQGVRGSQVTVVARTAAAAAKLRLVLSDWPQELQSKGWGIQSLAVTAQRIQDISPPVHQAAPRSAIPGEAKKTFEQLSSEFPNEALRKALARIGRQR